VELERDGFAEGREIAVNKSLKRMTFTVENRSGDSHETLLSITANGRAKVKIDGKRIKMSGEKAGTMIYVLPVSADSHSVQVRLRHKRNAV
jgi:hypothetical protein